MLDYDQDGYLDLFFTNGARLPELEKTDASFYNCLLRNRGEGRFEEVTRQVGLEGAELGFCFGVAVGDYNNDGYPDLFLCNAGPNALYRNNRDGTFTEVTAGSGLDAKAQDLLSVDAAWLDYDQDSLLDLVVSQYTFWNPESDQPCYLPDGKTEVYCDPQRVRTVPNTLYRNLGEGRFQDVSQEAGFASVWGRGMGVGVADFNRDGNLDIFVANDKVQNLLYLNRGKGSFEEASLVLGVAYNPEALPVSGMGCDVKDFNNDGWSDIFYNNLRNQIHALFQNHQGRYFDYVSPQTQVARLSREFSGWSCGFIDFDNDGWKDLYSANGDVDYIGPHSAQHDTLLRNREGKSFEDVSATLGRDFLRVGYQRGAAFGDLNNDGFLDLVVTSLNEKPRILINSAGNGNHWILLHLVGRRSNRDAAGTVVRLTTTSGRRLYNHVSTSMGFMSSSDPRLHFGLGKEETIRSLEILWPSGQIQQLEGVEADQILRLEEPE